MSIVLATNVLVSGLLRRRTPPGRIVNLVVSGQVRIALDARIFAEYCDVLLRPEFDFPRADVLDLVEFLWSASERVAPRPLPLRLPDPDDAMFIEVAVAGRVSALVTGNARHFPVDQRHGIRVLSPRHWLEEWLAKGA